MNGLAIGDEMGANQGGRAAHVLVDSQKSAFYVKNDA